jgi:hypothetical protein
MTEFADAQEFDYEYEGDIDGIPYVTVLDLDGNPIEYEIPYSKAFAKYGDESWQLPPGTEAK